MIEEEIASLDEVRTSSSKGKYSLAKTMQKHVKPIEKAWEKYYEILEDIQASMRMDNMDGYEWAEDHDLERLERNVESQHEKYEELIDVVRTIKYPDAGRGFVSDLK